MKIRKTVKAQKEAYGTAHYMSKNELLRIAGCDLQESQNTPMVKTVGVLSKKNELIIGSAKSGKTAVVNFKKIHKKENNLLWQLL